MGCHWPGPDVWTRVNLFFDSLLLANRCCSADNVLLPHACGAQVSASISQCTGDAGRNGLASPSDPAQLFDVGTLGIGIQLLDHEEIPWMVAQVQYVCLWHCGGLFLSGSLISVRTTRLHHRGGSGRRTHRFHHCDFLCHHIQGILNFMVGQPEAVRDNRECQLDPAETE